MKRLSLRNLRKNQIDVWTDRFDTVEHRFQMAFTVAVTGAFGFFVSYSLLELGVGSMAVRYPIAVSAAYLFFLGLLFIWLTLLRRRGPRSGEGADLDPSAFDLPFGGGGGPAHDVPIGSGGHFGGGGAGGHFPVSGVASPPSVSSSTPSDSAASIDLPSVDLDEGCAFVLPVLVVMAGVIGSVWVVWTAPTLLAELMVDGVLVAALYRRLGRSDEPNWLLGAVRRTWAPALAVAFTTLVLALGMQLSHPEAQSIGAFWKAVNGG